MPAPSPLLKRFQPAQDLLRRLITIKPQESQPTIGVDVGTTAVKVVALGPGRGTGARPVLAQHLMPRNGNAGEADVSAAIQSAVSRIQPPVKSITVGVSGQLVIMRIVEMPAMKPDEIKKALPFEAQRYLPFDIKDVVIDGEVLGTAESNKVWVLVVACKKDLIEQRRAWVKQAGLELSLIDVDALALVNGFLEGQHDHHGEGTRALINVGGQVTNLVVMRGNTPYLVRDIPWGAKRLVRDVAEQAGVEPAAIATGLVKGGLSSEATSTLKLATETLVTELQLSFDYFENRFGQPPESGFLSGGLALSAAFLEALQGHLTQTIARWTPAPEVSEQFAVAYGLALRAD